MTNNTNNSSSSLVRRLHHLDTFKCNYPIIGQVSIIIKGGVAIAVMVDAVVDVVAAAIVGLPRHRVVVGTRTIIRIDVGTHPMRRHRRRRRRQ